MTDNRFQDFLNKNRQPGNGPADVRGGIAKMREKKANTGALPYIANLLGGVARGMTQVAETPYNAINRAPQLVNLLPGDQGVRPLDEQGVEPFASMGKDPLINFVADNYPHMNDVGGIRNRNPEYPITNRVSEDIGTGLATMGAGTMFTGAKGLAGMFGKYLGQPLIDAPVRSVVGQVASSMGAAGGRAVADHYDVQNPVGRFALEMAGGMAPTGAFDAVEAGGRKLLSREGGQATVDAMDRLNMRPSIGLTGNQNASTLENAAAILPFVGSVSKNVQIGQIDDFGNTLRSAASKVRPNGAASQTDGIMLGEQVHDIAKGGLGRMKANFSNREDALMNAIGPTAPVDISNTRKAITDMIPKVDPEMQGALKNELNILDEMAAGGNTVPYEQLRSFRTNVGRRTNQPSLAGGQSKQIYKAITADTEAVANAAGQGDEFRNLMKEQATAHNDELRLSEGGDIPAMEGLANNQLERGKAFFQQSIGNPDRVSLLKRNATPEQWQQFAADTMEHLGIANNAGQGAVGDLISPNTFLTNWNKMDPRVKNMMFDDNLGTRQTLDDLAIVAEAMRQRGNSSNFSNTAGVGMSAGALGAIGTGAGMAGLKSTLAAIPGAATGAAITYGTIKALMSQTMARWAANQGVPLGDKMVTQGVTSAAKAANTTEQKKERRYTPQPEPLRITVRPSDKNNGKP